MIWKQCTYLSTISVYIFILGVDNGDIAVFVLADDHPETDEYMSVVLESVSPPESQRLKTGYTQVSLKVNPFKTYDSFQQYARSC